jgi:hypothetical protein
MRLADSLSSHLQDIQHQLFTSNRINTGSKRDATDIRPLWPDHYMTTGLSSNTYLATNFLCNLNLWPGQKEQGKEIHLKLSDNHVYKTVLTIFKLRQLFTMWSYSFSLLQAKQWRGM